MAPHSSKLAFGPVWLSNLVWAFGVPIMILVAGWGRLRPGVLAAVVVLTVLAIWRAVVLGLYRQSGRLVVRNMLRTTELDVDALDHFEFANPRIPGPGTPSKLALRTKDGRRVLVSGVSVRTTLGGANEAEPGKARDARTRIERFLSAP